MAPSIAPPAAQVPPWDYSNYSGGPKRLQTSCLKCCTLLALADPTYYGLSMCLHALSLSGLRRAVSAWSVCDAAVETDQLRRLHLPRREYDVPEKGSQCMAYRHCYLAAGRPFFRDRTLGTFPSLLHVMIGGMGSSCSSIFQRFRSGTRKTTRADGTPPASKVPCNAPPPHRRNPPA